jgi:hypothetical protein
MSDEEIDFVEYLLYAMSGWETVHALTHAAKRAREDGRHETRQVTHAEILRCIKTGRCIEVNSFGRILIRDKHGICVVVSLCDRHAVTTWKCDVKDTHQTLDRSIYKWKVNVIEYIKGLRSTR